MERNEKINFKWKHIQNYPPEDSKISRWKYVTRTSLSAIYLIEEINL